MKSRGYLLATASGVAAAAAAGGAHAADMRLPAKAPYTPPPPVASWAGWYIGANVGAAWQSGTFDQNNFVSGTPKGRATTHATGFTGGGQIGYNWQSGNFVYGLEADINGIAGTGGATGSAGKQFSNRIRWLSTVRGRAGFAFGGAMDYLAYATGGVAFGGVKNSTSEPAPSAGCCQKSISKTNVGWAIGGGLEHLLSPNWIVGIEALYVDLGNNSGHENGTFKTGNFSNQAVIARVKLNYKW
jgi:outer membrane immunogenic protein